jgi:hypothetical protein
MSVVSGLAGASASKSAAGMQEDASELAAQMSLQAVRETNALQEKMYNQGREDTRPWREQGSNALYKLKGMMDVGPGNFVESPGYQFRLDEGQKAIERGAAARGNLMGGANQKALTRYGQDYASGEYSNFLTQYYQSLAPWQSMSGLGQSTAMGNATQGQGYAASVAQNTLNGTNAANNYLMAGANAGAAGLINQANAFSGMSNSGVNNYLAWKNYNRQPATNPASSASSYYTATNPAARDFTASAWS